MLFLIINFDHLLNWDQILFLLFDDYNKSNYNTSLSTRFDRSKFGTKFIVEQNEKFPFCIQSSKRDLKLLLTFSEVINKFIYIIDNNHFSPNNLNNVEYFG